MAISVDLLDRTPASRVVVDLGTAVGEFLHCLVAMDGDGRAVHIWEHGNDHQRPSLSVALAAVTIEWGRDEAGRREEAG